MDWFHKAKTELLSCLEESRWVDGTSFLRSFLLNESDEFTEMDEEEQDVFIIEVADNFENYLKDDAQDSISIGKRYRWSSINLVVDKKQKTPVNAPVSEKLNEELLAIKVELLTEIQALELLGITTTLHKEKEFINCYKFGNKYYEYSKFKRLPDSDVLSLISILIDAGKGSQRVDLYKLHCDKADIYLRSYDHDNAASEYENAIDVLNTDEKLMQKKIANYNELKRELFRRCRIQYENSGNDLKASETYVNENKYTQKTLKKGIKRGLMFLFWLVARYGESPGRVACWAIALIVLCSFVYMGAGVNPPGGTNALTCLSLAPESVFRCEAISPTNITEVSYWSHLYYSVVTFTTLGYGDFSPQEGISRFVSAFQAVMGLILTSLFLATFVKKYSR